jgi:hypothetical protein
MTNSRCFKDADTVPQNHTQQKKQDKTGQNVSAAKTTVKIFLFFFKHSSPLILRKA